MKPTVSIRKALSDPNLLGTTLAGDTWSAWRILLIAMMGEAADRRRARGVQAAHRPRARADGARRRVRCRRR